MILLYADVSAQMYGT